MFLSNAYIYVLFSGQFMGEKWACLDFALFEWLTYFRSDRTDFYSYSLQPKWSKVWNLESMWRFNVIKKNKKELEDAKWVLGVKVLALRLSWQNSF